MQHTIDRPRGTSGSGRTEPRADGGRHRLRPVLLATFHSVPFHPEAARVAVDAAIECACGLLVVNAVEFVPGGRLTRYDAPFDAPEVVEALRAPAKLAHAFGVPVERLRVHSPHPVAALRALVAERRPALVAFGPDPGALRGFLQPSRRRYRRFLAALEGDARYLLWSAEDVVAGAARRPSANAVPVGARGRIADVGSS